MEIFLVQVESCLVGARLFVIFQDSNAPLLRLVCQKWTRRGRSSQNDVGKRQHWRPFKSLVRWPPPPSEVVSALRVGLTSVNPGSWQRLTEFPTLKLSLQLSSLIDIFVTKKPKWQLQSAVQCPTTTTTHLPLLCHWHIDDNQPSHWHMSIPLYGIWVTANTVLMIVDQPPFANLVKQITTTCTLVFTPSPSTALRSF